MNVLQIALDYDRWPECQDLRDLRISNPGDAMTAADWVTLVVMRLWVFLGYLASRGELGWLAESRLSALAQESPALGDAKALGEILERARLLRPDAVDGQPGWWCDRFKESNPQLERGYRSMQSKGSDGKRFSQRMQREQGQLMQLSLLVDPEVFKLDGKPMDPALVRRTILLIRGLDNALRMPERHPSQFTPGLVRDSGKLASRTTDEQIQFLLRAILGKRGHPSLPPTTEQILARWDEVMGLIKG